MEDKEKKSQEDMVKEAVEEAKKEAEALKDEAEEAKTEEVSEEQEAGTEDQTCLLYTSVIRDQKKEHSRIIKITGMFLFCCQAYDKKVRWTFFSFTSK